jgi:hypothetical protein
MSPPSAAKRSRSSNVVTVMAPSVSAPRQSPLPFCLLQTARGFI